MRNFFLYDVDLGGSPGETLRATEIMSKNYVNARACLFRKHGNPIIIAGIEEKAETDHNCRLTDDVYLVRESQDQRIKGQLTKEGFWLFVLGLELAGVRANSIIDL